MKIRLTSLVVLVALLAPSRAWAAEDVPLAEGSKAPFTGILVSTDSYAQSLKDKAELDKLKTKATVQEELLKLKESKYQELLDIKAKEAEAWRQQADKNAQRTWWDENKLQAGVLLGMVTTIAVTFAVAQAVNTTK